MYLFDIDTLLTPLLAKSWNQFLIYNFFKTERMLRKFEICTWIYKTLFSNFVFWLQFFHAEVSCSSAVCITFEMALLTGAALKMNQIRENRKPHFSLQRTFRSAFYKWHEKFLFVKNSMYWHFKRNVLVLKPNSINRKIFIKITGIFDCNNILTIWITVKRQTFCSCVWNKISKLNSVIFHILVV